MTNNKENSEIYPLPSSLPVPLPEPLQRSFDTLKVQAGYNAQDHNWAVSVPIYQTTAFALGDSYRADSIFAFEDEDPCYTRLSNPTVDVLERRVAALHGAPAAIALASGMAAISYTLLNVAGAGGHILTTARLYGGTVDAFNHIYPELGIVIDVVEDADDLDEFKSRITEQTKAIFVEAVTNPTTAVTDLEALAQIAHDAGIPLIVDNTLLTPYLLNPFDFGADVVVYSATKALSGHGNVIAGLVVESGNFDYGSGDFPQFETPLWFLRDKNDTPRSILQMFADLPFTGRLRVIHLGYLGAALSPFDAYLILLGIETLSERLSKQVANTLAVLEYLEQSLYTSWVHYPTATNSPYKELAQKYLPKGAGAILTFGFKGSEEQKRKFLAAVKIFGYQANIGDARSLIINPAQTTHIELTDHQRQITGLTSDTIRLSLGLEAASDLIADLEQAFQKSFA